MMRNSKSNRGTERYSEEREPQEDKGRGPRRGGRRKSYRKDDNASQQAGAAYNDPSWYVSSPLQAAAAANLSFGQPTGDKFRLLNVVSNNPVIESQYGTASTPGFMSLRTMSTPGISSDLSDPINLAAQDIYAWVRHANAGHTNYDPVDLMLYLLAMDEMFSMYSWLKRAYGISRNFTSFNRYYPKGLLEAMNFDADDFHDNLSRYHYLLLLIESNLRKFNVPTGMSYFTRHQWMYSGLFTDAVNIKAQTYFYTPAGFRIYDEMSGTPGHLDYTHISEDTRYTYGEVKNIFDRMMSGLIASEDCGIISGDIAKAYSSLFSLPETPIDYQVLPVYNPEVLQQFHNATIMNRWYDFCMASPQDSTIFNITQEPTSGAILFNPPSIDTYMTMAEMEVLKGNRLLDMQQDVPTPNDVIVATRLQVTGSQTAQGICLSSCGSEVVVRAEIGFNKMVDGAWKTVITEAPGYVEQLAAATSMNLYAEKISMTSAFTWRPMVNILSTTTAPHFAMRLFETNNYTVIGSEELEKMHRLALTNMFMYGRQNVQSK